MATALLMMLTPASLPAAHADDAISWPVAVNETNFPDSTFRDYVKERISNTDGDADTLTRAEAEAVTDISFRYSIDSLKGIEYFTKLTKLDASSNYLTSLDVSHNTQLTDLDVSYNNLKSLDVSHNTQLTKLDASNNKLTSLDLSHNTQLTDLDLYADKLTSLDLNHNTQLEDLDVRNNKLTSLDVSHNTQLTRLYADANHLTSLDLSHNTQLENLSASSNSSSRTAVRNANGSYSVTPSTDESFDASKVSNVTDGTWDETNKSIVLDSSNPTWVTYRYGTGYASVADSCSTGLIYGCKQIEVTINIIYLDEDSLTLDHDALTLTESSTGKLKATAPAKATDKTVIWSSSDWTVATVDSEGTVTAMAPGTATITAKAGGQTATATVTVTAKAGMTTGIVYRLYNPNSSQHLFTQTSGEYAQLQSLGWHGEGAAWRALGQNAQGQALYRLYNPNTGEHLYTTSRYEYDSLSTVGWNGEDVAWYSPDKDTDGAIPVYRLYNPNGDGGHHYTTDRNERDQLVSFGWRDEGTCFYAMQP
ncbi:Ig-like domain-containing protein [Pseudoscardovia radai]|uniref:Ig-like domain-containing protein n=1 Tax=Pseudoscardovia radai TaxID=987066 RepID=UPI003994640A